MKQEYIKYRKSIYWALTPIALFIIMIINGCHHGKSNDSTAIAFNITAKNNTSVARQNVLVELNKTDLFKDDSEFDLENMLVFSGQTEIPSQSNSNKLYFMIDQMAPGAEVNFLVKEGNSGIQYSKRTQAEISVKDGGHFEDRKYIGGIFKNVNFLRVPDEHTDHSYFIRYEGPGWESDLVAYRFYLDWRNATDVFGKKTNEMVLQQVGQDGFDSYHEMQDWGVDVLKVGKSLGIGSLGMFVDEKAIRVDKTDSITCEIIDNGDVRSSIKTRYYGWEVGNGTYDVESILSIHAGTRLTKQEIKISGTPDNLCTGIGKDVNANLYTHQGNANKWGYLATYGKQSLNNDLLGLAVLFENKDYKGFTEEEHSHVVKLNVEDGGLNYYFLAAWEGEINGIANEAEFLKYVDGMAQNLANPIEIVVESIK